MSVNKIRMNLVVIWLLSLLKQTIFLGMVYLSTGDYEHPLEKVYRLSCPGVPAIVRGVNKQRTLKQRVVCRILTCCLRAQH